METQKGTDANGGRKTLVEEGTEFRGSLASTCPVVVKGKVDGEVTAPSLDVSSTGSIRGRLKVGAFVCAGELSGEVDAESVQLSGVVKDQTVVRARSLDVSLGPNEGNLHTVFGECLLEIGEVPNKEAAITASMNAVNRNESAKAATTQSETAATATASPAPAAKEHATAQPAPGEGQPERNRGSNEGRPTTGAEASPSVVEPAASRAPSASADSAPNGPASTNDPAAAIIRALSDPADSEPVATPTRHEQSPVQIRRSSTPPKRIS